MDKDKTDSQQFRAAWLVCVRPRTDAGPGLSASCPSPAMGECGQSRHSHDTRARSGASSIARPRRPNRGSLTRLPRRCGRRVEQRRARTRRWRRRWRRRRAARMRRGHRPRGVEQRRACRAEPRPHLRRPPLRPRPRRRPSPPPPRGITINHRPSHAASRAARACRPRRAAALATSRSQCRACTRGSTGRAPRAGAWAAHPARARGMRTSAPTR